VKAHHEALEHDAYLAVGGDDEDVYVDDHRSHGKSDILHYKEIEAGVSVVAIREAFATALFHLWERSARSWVKFDEQGYLKLTKELRRASIPIDPRLDRVNELISFLKHNNKKKEDHYKNVLRVYIHGPHLKVSLSNDDLHEIIEIIEKSCPPPTEFSPQPPE
jgi:hypothetical protein